MAQDNHWLFAEVEIPSGTEAIRGSEKQPQTKETWEKREQLFKESSAYARKLLASRPEVSRITEGKVVPLLDVLKPFRVDEKPLPNYLRKPFWNDTAPLQDLVIDVSSGKFKHGKKAKTFQVHVVSNFPNGT